jgi:competence protein ComEA
VTEISRSQFAIAAVVVVAVVLLGSHALSGGGGALTPATAASSYGGERSASVSTAPTAAPADGGVRIDTAAGGAVVVHVAGRVRHPGLYRLKDGQRIADAIRRAGGRAKGADLDAINLAAKLTDGEQVLVPRRAATVNAVGPAAASGDSAPGAIVSLNSATEEQLETIDGVGPATAAKIIEFRQTNGGFRSVDDLAQISGIGPKRLEAMRPHVGV